MILNYSQTRTGPYSQVTVTTNLVGAVWFHWYFSGAFIATTKSASYAFLLQPNEKIRIEVIDTNDPDFDPIANAPAGYPGRRAIFWIRSTDADVAHYRLEQRKDAGTWSTVATSYDRAGKWAYILQTGILVDLASYEWRIIPVDHAGNDGDSIALAAETIVRTPDAPNFALAFDEITRRVTFSEVA